MPRIRLTEFLAALSLTTDLATGLPFEKGLRTCLVATAFAGTLGLRDADRAAGQTHVGTSGGLGRTVPPGVGACRQTLEPAGRAPPGWPSRPGSARRRWRPCSRS